MMKRDKFFRNLCTVIITIIAALIFYMARTLMPPVVLALIIAYILYPVLEKLSGLGIPKGMIIFFIFSLFFGAISCGLYSLLPAVNQEVLALTAKSDSKKSSESKLAQMVVKISSELKRYKIIKVSCKPEQVVKYTRKWLRKQSKKILNSLSGVAKNTMQFMMIFLFVLVFSLLDGDKFYKTIVGLIPNSFFEPGIYMLRKTNDLFGYYIRGLVIENFLLGMIAFTLLAILGYFAPISLSLAVIIAIIIALTNVIRIVGPFIGGAIGVLLILTSNPDLHSIVGVIIVAIIVQLFDNALVLPLVMQEQVDVHPVVCLLSVMVGGILAGIFRYDACYPRRSGSESSISHHDSGDEKVQHGFFRGKLKKGV